MPGEPHSPVIGGERRSSLPTAHARRSLVQRSSKGEEFPEVPVPQQEGDFRKKSDTSIDSTYGSATKPEQFEMTNPIHSMDIPLNPPSSPISEQKRASIAMSAGSRVDTGKLLERHRTRTHSDAPTHMRSHTQSEAMPARNSSTADDFYVRETQSEVDDADHVPSENFEDFSQPVEPVRHPGDGIRQEHLYIHVRHFTKFFNRTPVALNALIWFENGDCFGPVSLSNHRRGQSLTKPMAKYHLMGEVKLAYPFASPVAFIQLRKKVGSLGSSSGLDTDIFIHDVYIKHTTDMSPDDNILAYFRFTGFLVKTSNLLIPNVVTHDRKLTSAAVANDSRNKNRFVQDKLMPPLEWATVEASQVPNYKRRTMSDAIGTRKTGFDVFMDFLFQRSTPMFYNLGLSMYMDVARYAGTPGFAKIPPNDQTFSALKFDEFVGSRKEPGEYVKKLTLEGKGPVDVSMLDFTPFLESDLRNTSPREITETRRVVASYDTDEEFGRLYVESLLCNQLRVVRSSAAHGNLPSDMACKCASESSTNAMCFDFLHGRGWREEKDPAWIAEMAAATGIPNIFGRKLFYADYSKLVGIPRNEEHGYFSPARCLLLLDTANRLVPVAISLFYPEQNVWKTHLPTHASWSVAKMFCKCAAGQDHQIISHALNTHLVVEPFAIALERRVPLDHILYRVLKTHFRYTIDVNFKARTALINKEGLFDQFVGTGGIHAGHLQYMLKLYSEWTFDMMCFPDEMRSRGFVNDPTGPGFELPGYMYARDAGALWSAIAQYCTGIVEEAYSSDEAFRADDIARNFFMEVQAQGFPTAPTFVPTNRTELSRVLSGIIYTAAVQHAAVNFPQFSHYGFVANSPLCVVKPAPEPGESCRIRDYLPATEEATKAIATVWGLSRFVMDDERFLLAPDRHFFNLSLWNDPKFKPFCTRLQLRLQALENTIQNRAPSAYGTKYMWLQPSMLPTSIAS